MEEIKNEENTTINEAEITEVKSEEMKSEEEREISLEETAKKKKTDFYIELGLFLILGILIGIAVKTEAAKRITIGFDDYKMKIATQDYDINKIEADLVKKNAATASQSQGADNSAAPSQGQGTDATDNSGNQGAGNANQQPDASQGQNAPAN